MKKQLLILLTCLIASAHAYADDCNAPAPTFADNCNYCWNDCFGFESVFTFDVGGGYRNDSLKWKRSTPNAGEVVQERWNNVGMGIVETNVNFLACEHYLFKVDFDYGYFNRGGHQTYKVINDNVLTNSLKSRTSGHVYDLSGGVGYQFNFDCYRVSFAPLAGYSYDYQKFNNRKYSNELAQDDASTTLKNKYTYRWSGPWLGAAFAYQPCGDILVFFDYAFHWTRLKAKVNENFIAGSVPASFRVNDAYGNEFTVGADYLFCDDWLIGVKFNYKNFWGKKGKFHTHSEDIANSNARKLTWVSYNVTLDIGYKF